METATRKPTVDYFSIYATSNGNTEKQQLAIDRKLYHGGALAGYHEWLEEMTAKFYKEKGLVRTTIYKAGFVEAWFDRWLKKKPAKKNNPEY